MTINSAADALFRPDFDKQGVIRGNKCGNASLPRTEPMGSQHPASMTDSPTSAGGANSKASP